MLTFISIIVFLFGLGLNRIYDDDTNKQHANTIRLCFITLAIMLIVRMLGTTLSAWLKALICIAPVYIRFISLFIKRVYKRYKLNMDSNNVSQNPICKDK